jgi:hypothetical protein
MLHAVLTGLLVNRHLLCRIKRVRFQMKPHLFPFVAFSLPARQPTEYSAFAESEAAPIPFKLIPAGYPN